MRDRRWLTGTGPLLAALCVGGWCVGGPPVAAAPMQDAGNDDDDKPKGPSPDDKGEEDRIKLAELDPEFQERVNAAVGRGIPYLLSLQKPDGRWTSMHDTSEHGPFPNGTTALVLLTLIKAGDKALSDEVTKGIKFLQDSWANFKSGGFMPSKQGWKTYEVGITLMMLEAMAAWRPQSMQKGHTQAVGKGFKPEWKQWVKELRDFLLNNIALSRQESFSSKQGAGGLIDRKETWSYPGQAKISDHSNTQYAVLGLHAAQKLGEPTPASVWIAVLEGMIYTQAESGPTVPQKLAPPRKSNDPYVRKPVTVSGRNDRARGWGYGGAAKPAAGSGQQAETGSMTTVGLACVALAWHNLGQGRDKDGLKYVRDRKNIQDKDRSLDDGFAWLDHNWDVTKNPNYGTWHYYYLYGLERAGILGGRQMIGGHDWYREGGELLLSQQRGSMWDDANGDGPEVSTCFALLFLTRATVPLTAVTRH